MVTTPPDRLRGGEHLDLPDVEDLVPARRRRLRPWLALVALDAAATAAAWVIVLTLSSLAFSGAHLAALAAVTTGATLGSVAARQLYREHVRRVVSVELSGLIRATFVATVAAAVGASVLRPNLGLRLAVDGFLVQATLLVVVRGGARCVVRAARRAGSFQQRVLLVGESSATAHLAEELSRRPSEGYVVVGAVGDERAHRLRQVACPYLGPVEDMERVLRASGATGAIVATDGLG
ncbi:MAG: hypothetical protein ABIS47_10060, partial [Acidimicrobiales bacterium]